MSVFSLVNLAVNVALPAFAAERRAAAPCCGAVAAERPEPAVVDRYLLPARRVATNPPHALLRLIDETETDGHPTVT